MAPPDPPRTAPERDPYEADEAELAAEGAGAADRSDLEALKRSGDLAGLLALAKAYRAGSAPGGRDMAKCLEAYRAAAALGNAEAEYAVALFSMNGGTSVAQDLKEGTTRLRSAAEKGSVPAKVYLGNLYELGIHYKADPEKADVWYRNAARAAHGATGGDHDEAETVRLLAELGAVRHVLALTSDPAMPEAEKARLLARAKAHGHGLKIRDEASSGDRATFTDALAGAGASHARPAGAMPVATATPPPVAVDLDPRQRKDTSPETRDAKRKVDARTQSQPPPAPALDPAARAAAERAAAKDKRQSAERRARIASALGAFGYALLFMVAGAGAGYAATLGARELVAHGHVLPLVGTRIRLVFPIVLGVIGVLPSWLVYRFGAVLKALLLGAAVGGVGWVAWGTGRGAFHGDRPLQAVAFGVAGFLAGLLVLGLLGGAKSPRAVPRPR